jgi:hypothetical protein
MVFGTDPTASTRRAPHRSQEGGASNPHRGRDPPTGPTAVRDHRVLRYMHPEQRVVMLGLLIIALSSAAILIITAIR